MVFSSIMARERPGIVGHPHDEARRRRWTPPRKFFRRRNAAGQAGSEQKCGGQDPLGGGAQDGRRFSRNAAIPSAASAEANSAWDTSVVRVNAASLSIPGIV